TPLNCLHAITASPSLYFCLFRRPPRHPLFPYTTLFRSWVSCACAAPSDMPAATASEPAIVVSFLLMVMILSPYRLLMTTVKALCRYHPTIGPPHLIFGSSPPCPHGPRCCTVQ